MGAGTVKDLGFPAESETERAFRMTTRTSAKVTDIQDQATVRWLAKLLEPSRERVQAEPDAERLDRIRLRVLGASAQRKDRRSIAA